jgi:hypothetical protein
MVNMSFWSSAISSASQFMSNTAQKLHAGADLLYRKGVSDYITISGGGLAPVTDISFKSDMERACQLSYEVYDHTLFFRSISQDAEADLVHTSPVCLTYYDSSDSTLFVACRGTAGFIDAAVDYSWLLDTQSIHDTKVRVPAFVANIVDNIMKEENLPSVINRLLKSRRDGIKRIIFTGHSLGGAIASALYIHRALRPEGEEQKIPCQVFTFGSPLVALPMKQYSDMTTTELRKEVSKLGLTDETIAFTEKCEFVDLLKKSESIECKSVLQLEDIDASNVHHVVYQLDPVPRLVGPHPLPELIMTSDIGKRLLSFVESHDTKRTDYRAWGRFYSLYNPIDTDNLFTDQSRAIPVLEESLNPTQLLSLFPENVVSLPLSITDHNLRKAYWKSLRELLSLPPIVVAEDES